MAIRPSFANINLQTIFQIYGIHPRTYPNFIDLFKVASPSGLVIYGYDFFLSISYTSNPSRIKDTWGFGPGCILRPKGEWNIILGKSPTALIGSRQRIYLSCPIMSFPQTLFVKSCPALYECSLEEKKTNIEFVIMIIRGLEL